MAAIKAFRGIVYNREKAGNIAGVVAPPYDVISSRMQEELYRKSPYNVVRLILNKIKNGDTSADNRYTRAGKHFREWLKKGVLVRDDADSLYVYAQRYKYGGKSFEMTGFIGLMALDLGKKGNVLPHENTLKAPKADRLELMKNVGANLSPIFMLYEDPAHRISGAIGKKTKTTKPFIDVTIDGVRSRVWRISDKKSVAAIRHTMAGKKVFIADGHHRYETAVNYARYLAKTGAAREEKEAARFFMAYFAELNEKTLTILPTHRLIKDAGGLKKKGLLDKLGGAFAVEKVSSVNRMISRLEKLRRGHAFGVSMGKKDLYVIKLKSEKTALPFMGDASKAWKELDVSILHLFVIRHLLGISDADENIEFSKSAEEAAALAGRGKFKLAFILNPTKVRQMRKVAEAGEKMPRKATYFYPKPLSGLVINKF